ncbi:MAG: hypothetical protein ACMXX8_02290 [Candidatus Woesearchaeota archaeon]
MYGNLFMFIFFSFLVIFIGIAIYTLKFLMSMEKKIKKIDIHIEKMVENIVGEEKLIKQKENEILNQIKNIKIPPQEKPTKNTNKKPTKTSKKTNKFKKQA